MNIEEVRSFWDKVPCGSKRPPGNRYLVQPHIYEFAQFPRWNHCGVLEIGCGIGEDTSGFTNAGAYVDAVDISPESIRIAIRNNKQASFMVANAEEYLPTHPFGYSLIYSFGALHHTPHPEKVLRKAWLRLSSKGELRIMLYAKYSLKFMLGQQPEAQAGCPVVHAYSARSARKLLESCGFKVISITKTHIFPYKVSEYIQGRYVKLWIWRILPSSVYHWMGKVMGHHLLIVAVRQ